MLIKMCVLLQILTLDGSATLRTVSFHYWPSLKILALDLKSFQIPFFNPNIVSNLISRGAPFQSKLESHVGWIAQEFIAHFQGLLNLI